MAKIKRVGGTETGRSVTGVLEPPLRPHQIGWTYHGLTKHGDIGGDIRSIAIVDPGTCFIEADLAQAEPRIVGILSEDYELLKKFDEGLDVHKWTACAVFGVKEEDIDWKSNIGKGMRFTGKVTRNGGNFDMGKGTLALQANKLAKKFHIDVHLSEWKAGKVLDAFHAFSPKVRSNFHEGIRQALHNNNRTLVNPFGRPRQFLDRMGDELYKEGYAQIPQSTVRDHVGNAVLRIRKRYFEAFGEKIHIVVEAHDAITVRELLTRLDFTAKLIKEEFEKPIDFSRCTLSRGILKTKADVKVSYTNYMDFEDYKIA
jgi:DNA polymerase I-like protein with 3'-5' exonuclease and polymerase domains